jgi:hypothetical protein
MLVKYPPDLGAKKTHGFTMPCGAMARHCASGISRSVAVCTAWLMQRQARKAWDDGKKKAFGDLKYQEM